MPARGPDALRADPGVHRPPAGHLGAVHQLSREDLITILTEPRNAIVKQFQRFFGFDGIELVFSTDALKAVAEQGARARDRRPRPALDHRGDPARGAVRAALPPRRQEVRRDQGDDGRARRQADARHHVATRATRPHRLVRSPRRLRSPPGPRRRSVLRRPAPFFIHQVVQSGDADRRAADDRLDRAGGSVRIPLSRGAGPSRPAARERCRASPRTWRRACVGGSGDSQPRSVALRSRMRARGGRGSRRPWRTRCRGPG